MFKLYFFRTFYLFLNVGLIFQNLEITRTTQGLGHIIGTIGEK